MTNTIAITVADLERFASTLGYVPENLMLAWRQAGHSDAENDAAQIAILRGILEYSTRLISLTSAEVAK